MTRSKPLTNRSLPIALLRARERVMMPIRGMLADAGVTEQQWRVLRVLDEEGPLDPTTIASRAVLLLPSLTRILQKLEEKGLVTRRRDEYDRRRQVIEVTEAGRDIINANMDTSRRILSDLRERLGEERHEVLIDLLGELTELDFGEGDRG
ncbi:MAG: homoprotocatechuate degradation operon regulator HpaR [Rhodobacteraceae bacterium]|nr:homoprotocatechuate degradation operon regulator HpaR [Paracoccaceae bacterium]